MATGYGSNGICFSSSQEALDNHFGALPVLIELNSTTSQHTRYAHYKSAADSLWYLSIKTYSNDGALSTNLAIGTDSRIIQSCELPNSPSENFADGAVLGWGVVAAMVAAYAFHVMRRGL